MTEEDKSLQVLCLSETWISPSKLDLLRLDDFKLAASFSRSNCDGGGVSIFIRENIECEELCEVSKLSVEPVFETCAINIPCLNLIIVTIYIPDNKRNPDLFFNMLKKLLQLLCREKFNKRNIVIGGDFNIDMLVTSTQALALLELMSSFNFYQHVNEPTRVTNHSETCIDLVFTNFKCQNNFTKVKEMGLSDHKGVLVSIPNNNQEPCKTLVSNKRIFNDVNMNNFLNELNKVNFSEIIEIDKNANENFDSFSTCIQLILNKTIPKREIKIVKNRKKT